jgi:hypothetical protein
MFYTNASNAQQILKQRRLKQRFAAGSVIATSNAPVYHREGYQEQMPMQP